MPPQSQTIFPLVSRPGIKRDGTTMQGDAYTGGAWCRFQRGLPRKMGGYEALSWEFSGPVRGCHVFSRAGTTYVFAGSGSALERLTIDNTGTVTGVADLTPSGFTGSSDNIWQFDAMYDTGSAAMRLIAHAAPNLTDIDNTTQRPVYYGTITGTSLSSTGQSVAGGCVVLPPYLVIYDSDGFVKWSDANTPATFSGGDSGSARVTASKIVTGHRTRGGPSNSPAGLLWSLNALIRMSYVGGTAIFRFDEIGETSILSSSSVVEMNGVHFWPGIDGFLSYNGVIRDVPNDMNIDWFYDNLNRTYRQKVWGMPVPRFGEIWWFYPRGSATECTDAIVLNIQNPQQPIWYDPGETAPGAARSAGFYSNVYRYPLMFGLTTNSLSKYQLWQHETGTDEVYEDAGGNTVTNAIRSYFDTRDFSMPSTGPAEQWTGVDQRLETGTVELDLTQTGDMTMKVLSRDYPRGTDATASDQNTRTFSSSATKVDFQYAGRFNRFRMESNVAGGDYRMGVSLVHLKPGDTNR